MSRDGKLAVWETHVQEERDSHTRLTGRTVGEQSYFFLSFLFDVERGKYMESKPFTLTEMVC